MDRKGTKLLSAMALLAMLTSPALADGGKQYAEIQAKRVTETKGKKNVTSDAKGIAEDESAQEMSGQTLMVIPTELVPEVRELIT